MRYLRKFIEGKEYITKETLKDMCDSYLSYMKDNGFDINIAYSKYKDNVSFYIDITKFNRQKSFFLRQSYNWSDVSVDLIPFLNILNTKYDLKDILLSKYNGGSFSNFSINDVLNDVVNGTTDCIKIEIGKGIDDGLFNK
jgi:hypothetical protein